MTLSDSQVSVLEERNEMRGRVEAMKSLVRDGAAMDGAGKDEEIRLNCQLNAMSEYLRILEERARAFMSQSGGGLAELDGEYQAGFASLADGDVTPPCPRCGGRMEAWDAFTVTGASCRRCEWGMSEGLT